MTIKPLADRVVVKPVEEQEMKQGFPQQALHGCDGS